MRHIEREEPQTASILVVEDEAGQRRILADILRREGHSVREAATAEEGLELIQAEAPTLILCDWRMPGMGGGGLLAFVRQHRIRSALVVMTAYGSISHAVEAIRLGADDYLTKPFERETLRLAIQRVLRARALESQNQVLREALAAREGLGELVGQAPSMLNLYRTLQKVAATDVTVLICGESGTGKELVARSLHRLSHRSAGPFVAVNTGAIPETLIESELFGHEKGAFTGAQKRRIGKFEEAEKGTLFLDEIASMPLPLQVKLLRVLQSRRLTRLGGEGEVEIDVRIVAATNRDLEELVREGSFREDLYYRLNVLPVEIPALRDRREDIPRLARVFLERAAARHGIRTPVLPPDVQRLLIDHSWPGNVRELENVIERLVLLGESGALRVDDLPASLRQARGTPGCLVQLPPEGLVWDELESGLLRQALERAGGNRTVAARLLGLSYKTFLYRLEKYGLV